MQPAAAIAGGELSIRGKGLAAGDKPRVTIGDVVAPVVIGSDSLVIVKVPEGASAGELDCGRRRDGAGKVSDAWSCDIGICVAENLHPVTNPAVDAFGNIYTTFSGSRGQKVPVSVYRIDLNFNLRPFINDMMNPTGHCRGTGWPALHLQPVRWRCLSGQPDRQHVGVRGRHGRGDGHLLRPCGKSVCGRSQRHGV